MNLVFWRQQAETARRYLHKGSKIYVEGKLQTRSWDDKQTGQKRYATEVIVDSFTMLDTRSSGILRIIFISWIGLKIKI